MTKKKKIVLAAVIIAILFSACFVCVSIYAKKVINTPKFEVPDPEPVESLVEIPEDFVGKMSYIHSLYGDAFNSEVEVKKHNEYNFDYDSIESSLSSPDLNILKYAMNGVNGIIGSNYLSYDYTPADKAEKQPFTIYASGAETCEITQGQTDEEGNIKDDGFYFFNVSIYPKSAAFAPMADAFGLERSEKIMKNLSETLADTCKIVSYDITVSSLSLDGKADRVRNQLNKIRLCRSFDVKVELEFIGAYEALGSQTLKFKYNAADVYEFSWYGAHFTKQAIYMNPADMVNLPLSVTTNAEATKDDYSISFTVSDESVIEVDEDGIITAHKETDAPATVNMEFTYRGITYTDTLEVTVTELEVDE